MCVSVCVRERERERERESMCPEIRSFGVKIASGNRGKTGYFKAEMIKSEL